MKRKTIFIPISDTGLPNQDITDCESVKYRVVSFPGWIGLSKGLSYLYDDGDSIEITTVLPNTSAISRSGAIVVAQVDGNDTATTISTSTIRVVQNGQTLDLEYTYSDLNVYPANPIRASIDSVNASWTEVINTIGSDGTIVSTNTITGVTGTTFCGTNKDSGQTRTISGLEIERENYTVALPDIIQNKNTYTITSLPEKTGIVNGGFPIRCNSTSLSIVYGDSIEYNWEVYNEQYPIRGVTGQTMGPVTVEISEQERHSNLQIVKDVSKIAWTTIGNLEIYSHYVVSANTKEFEIYAKSYDTTSAFQANITYSAVTTDGSAYTQFVPWIPSWESYESNVSQTLKAIIRWFDAYGYASGDTYNDRYDNKSYSGTVDCTIISKDPSVPSSAFNVTVEPQVMSRDKNSFLIKISQNDS